MTGSDALDTPLHPGVAALAGDGPRTRIAASPVSLSAIRAWCNAIGLRDERYGGSGGDPRARPIAPPPMLQSWAGQGLAHVAERRARALHHDIRHAFREAGFCSVVATDYAQHYLADLHVGDVVEETSWIEHVSPLKATRLGQGHFVRISFEFHNLETRICVGRLTATTFYFRPPAEAADGPREAAPVHDRVSDIDPVEFELTPTLIVAGALASNDYEAVHHDRDRARADGLRDIIASIITSTGLVARYLLDHAYPRHRLKSLHVRLGTPAYPGDRLRLVRKPLERGALNGTIRVIGTTSAGMHLDARVVMCGPAKCSRVSSKRTQ